MGFVSEELKKFDSDWDSEPIISLPHRQQSNGKANSTLLKNYELNDLALGMHA